MASYTNNKKKDQRWVLVYGVIADEIWWGVWRGTGKRKTRVGGENPKNYDEKLFTFIRHMQPADHCTSKRLIQIVDRIKLGYVQGDNKEWKLVHDRQIAICNALARIAEKTKTLAINRIRHFDDEENDCSDSNKEITEWIYYNAEKQPELEDNNEKVESLVEGLERRQNGKNTNARKPKAERERIAREEIRTGVI